MTYQQKMIEHLEAAERWQVEVDAKEQVAFVNAKKLLAEKRARSKGSREWYQSDDLVYYYAKLELEKDYMYLRAVGNRDAHQKQAQLYGIAALVGKPIKDV